MRYQSVVGVLQAAVLVIVLASCSDDGVSPGGSAIDEADLVGEWFIVHRDLKPANLNEVPDTRGITRISVASDQQDYTVHMWGICQTTDCDWGETTTPVVDGIDGEIGLFWDRDFAEFAQVLALATVEYSSSGRTQRMLRLHTRAHFTDNSGRPDYDTVEYFERQEGQRTFESRREVASTQ